MRRCRKYEGLMERYLTGEVLPEERDDLERHLVSCPECSRTYRDLSEIESLLRTFPDKEVSPPPYLKTRILARIAEEAAPAGFRFVFRRAHVFFAVFVLSLVVAIYGYMTKPRVLKVVKVEPRVVTPAMTGENGTLFKEVKIFFYYPGARKVSVTGDFNDWDPEGIPMKKTGKKGLWEIDLKVKPGVYSYNFIIDGNMIVPDPNAVAQTPDGFGGTNSVMLVPRGDVS